MKDEAVTTSMTEGEEDSVNSLAERQGQANV